MKSECPFCSYHTPLYPNNVLAVNDIAYHIEREHPENGEEESPFLLKSNKSENPNGSMSSFTGVESVNSVAEPHDQEARRLSTSLSTSLSNPLCSQDDSYHRNRKKTTVEASSRRADDRSETSNPNYPDVEFESELPRLYPHLHERKSQTMETNADSKIREGPGLNTTTLNSQERQGKETEPTVNTNLRLGKKDLGPHAYENRMPSWLFKQLEKGPRVIWVNQIDSQGKVRRVEKIANETPGIIPHLVRLCRKDPSVSKAWLCSAGVKHIFKMHREGGFCGYRNIQMLVTWMQHNRASGYQHFPGSTPNILQLQELIEDAWDNGFNASGREQTGGIVGTRKFIGTPEAQALFQHLKVFCDTRAFTRNVNTISSDSVHERLLKQVLTYFSEGIEDPTEKVYETRRPPLYFQHAGHSMTIVGLEVHRNGSVNLLVFDPEKATPSSMLQYMSRPSDSSSASKVLKKFRRGDEYLGKYKGFELLGLESFKST